MTALQTATIVHVDAETGFSGGEVQVFLLMQGLAKRGWRNVLVAPPASAALERAASLGIETRPIAMRNDLHGGAVIELRRAFLECGGELVHLHSGRATWLGGLAARLAKLPAITTRRMDRKVRGGVRTRLVYRSLTRRVAAISPAVVRALERGGVPKERIRLIWSSIDPAALAPRRSREELRAELGVPADALVLLTLGALVPRKGIDVLLAALAELEEESVRPLLWVGGDGDARAKLEKRAKKLRLAERVRFLGARRDVGDLLAAADVFVMPSRREGLGVAALEAMSASLPLVASNVGGLGEAVVDGRTGLLVPPEDVSALAAALKRMLADAPFRASCAAEGPRRILEGFHVDQMVAGYEALYRELLAEPSAGASNRTPPA
ncbi:MAG: glycosyltransferase family 4 protein [Planctomycetes bacterium]|nr:glycosyltransferase family 4 protein [Planctomycetota bacterium]